MRSFNANFIIEKNKRADGPTPINLLTFGFATPVYLSDRDITPAGGPAHQGIVKSWGFVDSSITQTPGSGVLGAITIADLQLTLINSTSPPFSAKFLDTDPPENVIVTLYQWFGGRPYSEKEIIFKGRITSPIKYDLFTCTLTVRGIFDKYNKQIGADMMITPDAYPDADPDEYGKMQNIIYGTCLDVPCRAIVSGDVNSLVADITAAQTSIELSDSSYFPASGIIGIEAEQIAYTGNANNVLTGCTRGYGGTTATTHDAGAPVWEELAVFVYQIAGHPVKTINDIFVDGVRITSLCTKYTGQTGNVLAGYPGKAVFTVPSRLTRQQAIDLLVNDGITINDATSVVDTIGVTDGISISDTVSVADTIGVTDTIGVSQGSHTHVAVANSMTWKFDYAQKVQEYSGAILNESNICDDSYETYATIGDDVSSYISVHKNVTTGAGTIKRYRLCICMLSNTLPARIIFGNGISEGSEWVLTQGQNQTVKSDWYSSITTWANLCNQIFYVYSMDQFNSWSPNAQIAEVWLEVEYSDDPSYSPATGVAKTGSATKTGSVTKSGTVSKSGSVVKTGAAAKSGTVTRNGAVTLSGNSVADVKIGKLVTANIQGYQDTAAGTYTGIPNSLIERPDHVLKHLWCVLIGALLTDIDSASFTAAGTFYVANTYKFALLINRPIAAADLFMRLALQCRSRFLVTTYGTAKLFVRQLAQSSGHAIAKNEIKRDSVSVERSTATEIINLLNIYYELDLTKDSGDSQAYFGVWNITNATSITRYGQREWKGAGDLFLFDAVRDADMAQDVGLFLVDYHMQARKMPHFGVFLDNMEIEPGDIIDITHPLDAMAGFTAEVQKIMHHLGNAKQIDYVEIVAVEN